MKIKTVNGYYLLSLLLSMTAIEGARLRCFQCNTADNPNCGDPDYDVPTPCKSSANYCITLRALTETGGEANIKGCSSKHFNSCFVSRMGEINLTVCYKSCEIDGCNTSAFR